MCSLLFKWLKKIRDKIEVPKLKRGRKKKGEDSVKVNTNKSIKQDLFRNRYLLLKKKLSLKEKSKLKEYYTLFPELKELRRLYLLLKRIFICVSIDGAIKRYTNFITNKSALEHIPKVVDKLKLSYERRSLFSYLHFDKSIHSKIRTSNHTELINRKFRKKQKTHYRIKKLENKIRMLKRMMYFHNWRSLYGDSYLIVTVLHFLVFSAIKKFCLKFKIK